MISHLGSSWLHMRCSGFWWRASSSWRPRDGPAINGRFGKRRIAATFERLRVFSALNTVLAFNIVAREVGSVRLLKEERHLPLEMGEREQDIEREPAHRGGGVELLGDREERKSALGRVSGTGKA